MKFIDWSKPIETVEGKPARLLHSVLNPEDTYRHHVLIGEGSYEDQVQTYNDAGHYFSGGDPIDLRNVAVERPKLVGFVGVYGDDDDPAMCLGTGRDSGVADHTSSRTDFGNYSHEYCEYSLKLIIDLSKVNEDAIQWVEE